MPLNHFTLNHFIGDGENGEHVKYKNLYILIINEFINNAY
jgi:hypothetical protein